MPANALPLLHYIFDPLCGWCYAAAPLLEAARGISELRIEAHAGGMMTGANRRPVTAQWRDYVMPHDKRIAQLTGQPFSEAYSEGLLRDPGAVYDSEPPTTAILAAQALAGAGLDLLVRLQRAHYVEGRRIADPDVLIDAARQIGLDEKEFGQAMARWSGERTAMHIVESRQLLNQVGGHGFPTFALQLPGKPAAAIDVSAWLGRPGPWTTHLQTLIGAN